MRLIKPRKGRRPDAGRGNGSKPVTQKRSSLVDSEESTGELFDYVSLNKTRASGGRKVNEYVDDCKGEQKDPQVIENLQTEGRNKGPDKKSDKSEYQKLLHKGVKLLSMREHSRLELQNKLAKGEPEMSAVYAVLDELAESNYQSDNRFTESYVRSRSNRGFGPQKIKSELSAKGVREELISEYLNTSSAIWFDNAQYQYKKKYGDEPVTDYNTWTKRARFLQSRGFSMEHIQSTVSQVEEP